MIVTSGNIQINPHGVPEKKRVEEFINKDRESKFDIGVVDSNLIRVTNLDTGKSVDVKVRDFIQFNTGVKGSDHLVYCQVCGEFTVYAHVHQNPETSQSRMTKHTFVTQHICPSLRASKITLPRLTTDRHPDSWVMDDAALMMGFLKWRPSEL